jgi:hypothetical protein
MCYATSKGSEGNRERTEYGELIDDLRTAAAIKSTSALRSAREALDRYHAARGGRPTSTRTAPAVRPSTSITPARGRPGASAAADLRAIDSFLAAADRSAVADARRRAVAPLTTRDGGLIVYDDDSEDDTDFEVVVTEAEQRRQLRELCRV